MDYDNIKNAIDNTTSMLKASQQLNIPFSTFKREATRLGLYNPNQGRKGIKRELYEYDKIRIPLNEILEGKFPFYGRNHLKKRLLKEKIFENKCSICGITEWQNKPLVCHLDHIDGNPQNHRIENLRMMCPNCHSQTDTYGSKNPNKIIYYSLEDFFEAVKTSLTYTEIKKKLGMSIDSPNKHLRDQIKKYGLNFKPKDKKSKVNKLKI